MTPLPLHPRRAQHLFQEALLTNANLTPDLSKTSLPERLLNLQRLNLSGIQEAKRGTVFQRIRAATASSSCNKSEEVTLQLTQDGSTLEITSETCTLIISIRLLDIKGITLFESPLHSFSLQMKETSNVDFSTRVDVADVFVAPSADKLLNWIITLTCGVNAFQQRQYSECNSSDTKAADLVWQAMRLRIFELAQIMSLPTATEHVAHRISYQDYVQYEALRSRVDFLYSVGNMRSLSSRMLV